MEKDNVLFMTAYVPHKAAAGEKNTMYMLNDLADEYNVDLIYYMYDYENEYIPDKENIKVVSIMKNSMLVKLRNFFFYPFVHPTFSIRFDWGLLNKIRKLLKERNYKAVILNHSNMFIYGKFIDKSVIKILVCHDVIIQRALRTSSSLAQKLCMMSEKKLLSQPNTHIFCLCEKDQKLIKDIYNLNSEVCLVYIDDKIKEVKPTQVGNYFVMLGDWSRKENSEGAIWLLNNISSLIEKDIEIRIIGRQFPLDKINMSNNLKIKVLGFVDNPYSIIANSKAMLCPLFNGAGIKVKVIESLACGTPVIGTAIAFEGLPINFNNFMILSNKPEEYISAMKNLNLSLEERIKTRENFIHAYETDSMASRVKRLINVNGGGIYARNLRMETSMLMAA